MIACTRCGHWHIDAEKALGRSLSCTEVKRYWIRLKEAHKEKYGHIAQITVDGSGIYICLKCKHKIE
jgi:DNA-directed RNA polymerase subunit RPC12/RpoP